MSVLVFADSSEGKFKKSAYEVVSYGKKVAEKLGSTCIAVAINAADARPSRWTGGEKVDVAIKEIQMDKRKVVLSIKLLEEIEKKEALDKYGSEGSGKNLPFSSLSEDLKKKEEDK